MTSFRKIIYSGTCLCGHCYEDHHIGMVLNPEAAAVMGPFLPEECEFFGCNETGGLDEKGEDHCARYVDAADPDEAVRARWEGTRRPEKKRVRCAGGKKSSLPKRKR